MTIQNALSKLFRKDREAVRHAYNVLLDGGWACLGSDSGMWILFNKDESVMHYKKHWHVQRLIDNGLAIKGKDGRLTAT